VSHVDPIIVSSGESSRQDCFLEVAHLATKVNLDLIIGCLNLHLRADCLLIIG
jgi:hypothetical protein